MLFSFLILRLLLCDSEESEIIVFFFISIARAGCILCDGERSAATAMRTHLDELAMCPPNKGFISLKRLKLKRRERARDKAKNECFFSFIRMNVFRYTRCIVFRSYSPHLFEWTTTTTLRANHTMMAMELATITLFVLFDLCCCCSVCPNKSPLCILVSSISSLVSFVVALTVQSTQFISIPQPIAAVRSQLIICKNNTHSKLTKVKGWKM